MTGDPTVPVTCDVCGDTEECGMVPLAQNSWDMRNLESKLKSAGWRVDGDHHVCPDCVQEEQDDE